MLEETINIIEETPEEIVDIQDETEQNIEVQEETINVIQSGDKNYLHIQNIASDIWEINHGLNKFPSVTVIDSAGSEVIGDIEYIDVDNVRIKFAGSFSGKATLN